MKNAQYVLVCYILAASMLFSPLAVAGPAEEYKEAQLLYMTAAASFAAYPGVDGDIVTSIMRRDGWLIIPYLIKDETAKAKFLLAWKAAQGVPTEYLLAIAGTYNTEGMKLVFKTGKVYFAGKTFEEFERNAEQKVELPKQAPMVHKGFHQYAQTALSADVQPASGEVPGRKLNELLLDHPDWLVHLTGHSSGGSTAVLLGARLLSMGVKPEQIKVVTFAAPAVGNEVFVEKYAPVINVTRVDVDGDLLPEALRKFAGGYQQFGREVRWQISGYTFDEKHYPSIYLDCALRNYYDKRSAAIHANISGAAPIDEKPAEEGKRLYVAAIHNDLPKDWESEFGYMREVLLDQYRDAVPAYVIGEPDEKPPLHFEALRLKAEEAGCDRMVIVNIWAKKIDDGSTQDYWVVLEQAVFGVESGDLLDGRTYEKGSKYFTPLGALLSAAVELGKEKPAWSGQ